MNFLNKFCFFLSVLFISSCDSIPEDTESEIPLSKTDLLISALDNEPSEEKTNTLLFKANGFEPGWLIEIYEQNIKVILDYGNDSLLVKADFSKMKKSEAFSFQAEVDKNGTKMPLNIKLENTSCKDEATGELKEAKVTMKIGDKSYIACGNYLISR
jgi:hypothetical protein